MAEKDNASGFERDFGYLIPFLERVQAAGKALPADAQAELNSLLAGEKQRWERVRALLQGAAIDGEKATGAAAPSERRSGLTVGSLRGGPKR